MERIVKDVVWSTSRINTLLNNPGEYVLNYVHGIKPKQDKSALSMGSAIHWLLEHESTDATEYYNEKGNFRQWNNYSDEQCYAESIAESFFRHKEKIFNEILKDEETGEKLEIIDIQKELNLIGEVPSKIYSDNHSFLGIIDLLLLTNKGFILIDYKTSSKTPEWDKYKTQLYNYDFLLNFNFPEVPLYKVAIINLKKTNIRRVRGENDDSFRRRIKEQYIIDDELINCHVYKNEEFTPEQLKAYILNLSSMIDVCQQILDNKGYYINYSNIIGMYGPSQYAEIFYHTKDAQYLYVIRDKIFDDIENKILDYRDCDAIDMLVLDKPNILNKFDTYQAATSKIMKDNQYLDKAGLFKELKKNYICSDDLLEKYYTTAQKA